LLCHCQAFRVSYIHHYREWKIFHPFVVRLFSLFSDWDEKLDEYRQEKKFDAQADKSPAPSLSHRWHRRLRWRIGSFFPTGA
jgi:hypothetical protein